MKTIFSCLLILWMICTRAFAQQDTDDYASDDKTKAENPSAFDWKERLVYGGNLGLWVGSTSFVQLNPMVGVKLKDWWASGVAFNYTYFGNRTNNISYYGPSIWTRVKPLPSLYLHAEFGTLRTSYFDRNVPVCLLGAGYISQGGPFSFGLFLMYDVLQNEYSPYRGGFVPSGGFLIGF